MLSKMKHIDKENNVVKDKAYFKTEQHYQSRNKSTQREMLSKTKHVSNQGAMLSKAKHVNTAMLSKMKYIKTESIVVKDKT